MVGYTLPEHLVARRNAQRRDWLVQVVASVLAVVCLVGAGLLLGPLNRVRRERQLVIDPASVRGLPPDLALLGKLGTFRALAIDWASIRSERLKQEGKYYEAYELHRTVCLMQPRFPTAWANASWNMAYNISVTQYTPEARWRWVRDGIKLLRDEALRWNPKSVSLYYQLAWTYWHKIGDYLDDEHYNYKRALAVEMEKVLGPQPVALTTDQYLAWFQEIVDAPRDLAALRRSDEEVARLAFRLEQVGLPAAESLLEFAARHLRPELRIDDILETRAQEDPQVARRLEVLTDPRSAAAQRRLLAAVRSEVLRTKYRLDLDWALRLMTEQYGPLDWRSAYTHSLYWASLGNELARQRKYQNPADSMNNARLVLFSLHSLVARGRISLHPNFDAPFRSYIDFATDIRFIPYLFRTYLRLAEEQWGSEPNWNPQEGIRGTSYWAGFVNNMENWIQLLYFEGGEENLKQAESFYAYLRVNNPHPDGTTQERYTKTLDEFVMGDVLNQMATFRQSSAIIRSFILKSLKELAVGNTAGSLTALQRARQCHAYWMADTRQDVNERRKIPPLRVMRRDSIEQFLQAPEFDSYFKVRLWQALDLEGRQLTWDRLRPYFAQLCARQEPPWDAARAFPEPPGMDEVRRQDRDYRPLTPAETAERGREHKD